MKKSRQESFFFRTSLKNSFGGSSLKSNPKKPRPISTKQAMHVVIKSDTISRQRGFLLFERRVQKKILALGKKWGIKIYRGVVMTNHIHLILKLERRDSLKHFLREIGGHLGILFKTGDSLAPKCDSLAPKRDSLASKRDTPLTSHLFTGRPFSRILAWGKDFLGTHRYLKLNEFEKSGIAKDKGRLLLSGLESLRRGSKSPALSGLTL
jgi:REP element-mobilizing transposase RayT